MINISLHILFDIRAGKMGGDCGWRVDSSSSKACRCEAGMPTSQHEHEEVRRNEQRLEEESREYEKRQEREERRWKKVCDFTMP